MPYLGNKPVNNFISFAKQDITGNGGTSYSLDYPVTSANDIELFINNVRQEPTEAYSCSGSTLTLTEAVTSIDDVYVIFRGRALGTVNPSDGSVGVSALNTSEIDARYLNKSGDTMTGALTFNAGSANLQVRHDGTNAVIDNYGTNANTLFYLGGSNTTGFYRFHRSSDDNPAVDIDSAGRVTMPYQPSFRAYKTSSTTPNGAIVNWQGTFHNVGNHFNQSSGVFTAPITGNYLVSLYFLTENETNPVDGHVRVNNQPNDGIRLRSATSSGHNSTSGTAIIRMAANDTLDVYKENVGTFYGDTSKTWSSFSAVLLS